MVKYINENSWKGKYIKGGFLEGGWVAIMVGEKMGESEAWEKA